MADTKVMICAGGKGVRWNNYGGNAKHLAMINGEPLIHRTIRQFKEHFQEIILFSDNEKCAAYDIPITPDGPSALIGTCIGLTHSFWRHDKNNLVVLGDVVFSNEAIKTLVNLPTDDIKFIGRLGRNQDTQHGGEIFAIFIPGDKIERMLYHVGIIKQAADDGKLFRRCGWEVYKSLNDYDIYIHDYSLYGKNFIEILDYTDDFDCPEEYEKWRVAYEKLSQFLGDHHDS